MLLKLFNSHFSVKGKLSVDKKKERKSEKIQIQKHTNVSLFTVKLTLSKGALCPPSVF